jgi:glutamate synthase (NADPH/NADH) small chain
MLLVWPEWPNRLRTSSSHEEGCERMWSVSTTEFLGDGRVESLSGVEVDWRQENAAWQMSTVEASGFVLQADLVLLAMGFTGPVRNGLVATLGVDLDERGNVAANISDYATSVEGVFAAGDIRRGQSLVVWAIREGRRCARAVDQFLMGESRLPR